MSGNEINTPNRKGNHPNRKRRNYKYKSTQSHACRQGINPNSYRFIHHQGKNTDTSIIHALKSIGNPYMNDSDEEEDIEEDIFRDIEEEYAEEELNEEDVEDEDNEEEDVEDEDIEDEDIEEEDNNDEKDMGGNIKQLQEEDVINDAVVNKLMKQPFSHNDDTTDYLGMCDKIIELAMGLKENTKGNNNGDFNMIENYAKGIKLKMQQMKNIGNAYVKRHNLIHAFAKTTRNVTGLPIDVEKDYYRKIMEIPVALSDMFAGDQYGNPIGSPIYFIFPTDGKMDMVIYMSKLDDTTRKDKNERLIFGSYRLDSVKRVDYMVRDKDIQRGYRELPILYSLIFTDVESNISIKCYATDVLDIPTTTIRSLEKGLHKMNSPYIYEGLRDIVLRRVTFPLGLEFVEQIKGLVGEMTREKRSSIWEIILDVLNENMKLINQGYRYIEIYNNLMFKISIEEKEQCYISTIDPPYLVLHLACGHSCSIMALYGIIYNGESADTESILCPFCRANLIPKLVSAMSKDDRDSKTLTYYTKDDLTPSDSQIDKDFIFENTASNASNDAPIKLNPDQDTYIDCMFTRKNQDYSDDEDYVEDNTNQNVFNQLSNYLYGQIMGRS